MKTRTSLPPRRRKKKKPLRWGSFAADGGHRRRRLLFRGRDDRISRGRAAAADREINSNGQKISIVLKPSACMEWWSPRAFSVTLPAEHPGRNWGSASSRNFLLLALLPMNGQHPFWLLTRTSADD
jgi:hypothetical protein